MHTWSLVCVFRLQALVTGRHGDPSLGERKHAGGGTVHGTVRQVVEMRSSGGLGVENGGFVRRAGSYCPPRYSCSYQSVVCPGHWRPDELELLLL